MPSRKGGASRSLFAALPFELRNAIKSQATSTNSVSQRPTETVERSDVSTDAGRHEDASPNPADLLRTQPDSCSPSSTPERTEISIPIAVAPFTIEPVAGPSLTPDVPNDPKGKRKFRHTPSADAYNQLVNPITSDSLDSTSKNRGKRRRKVKVNNEHQGHPWDCTGLVPRFTKPSDVPPDLVKYWYQRLSLFPLYDELPLLLDTTGWFSVTPQAIAAQIADRCTCDTILDAFCGVGGNAIEFARTSERVIAMDNDPIRLRLARHNALHHGVADRIEFILADYAEFARSQKGREKLATTKRGQEIDVVFLSPPWGGPDYLTFQNPSQSTAEITGETTYPLSAILPIHGQELFDLTSVITPNIAFFLPRNVNIQEVGNLAPLLDAPDLGSEAMTNGTTRDREWVEIEEEWVGDKLKAVTAYFGSLATIE